MSERALGPLPISALRVGRTDVGAATAMLDDDALTLVVRVETEERPLRLRLAAIDSLQATGDELALVLRDGTRVSLVATAALRDAVLDRCRSLPELTRTLRAFGSSRARRSVPGGRDTDASEQHRFFAPLLEARRSAGSADAIASMDAFEASTLSKALQETLLRFAADRHVEPGPARRALEAELIDATEPLFEALKSLAHAASAAAAATEDLRLWRAWSAQLKSTFEIADRVWMAIDDVLDAAHRTRPAPARSAR
jgi:hypothetical protein